MRFRPCIDLRQGRVVQIVGATLRADGEPVTHYTAAQSPSHFAELYRRDGLRGGHVIMLGPGNEAAAAEALAAFPGGLQVGGGITADTAPTWLERGAAAVIVTSYVLSQGRLHRDRLEAVSRATGRQRLVLDLSCGRRGDRYCVYTDRWQRPTEFAVDQANLAQLAAYCGEFLVHAIEVEGRQQGLDPDLVRLLADISPLPTTYAGGIRGPEDLEQLERLGQSRLDYTVGAALDLFGGAGLRYRDLVERNRLAS
jgi:phosphoribosylformimino-5-aminoimidazole carboxamide ribotide isomerase